MGHHLIVILFVDGLLQNEGDEVGCPPLDRMRLKSGVTQAGALAAPRAWGVPLPSSAALAGSRDDDLRFRPLASQHATDACHGATRAVAGDEVVEPLASKIGQDLSRGRVFMDQGISRRLELRGEKPAVAVREFARLLIHAEALGSARPRPWSMSPRCCPRMVEPAATGSPQRCAGRVLRQFDLGVDGVIMHGRAR